MTVVYRCSECGKIIDKLNLDGVDEETLGVNILTEEERKDIIETEEDKMQINIICNQCASQEGWQQLSNSYVH